MAYTRGALQPVTPVMLPRPTPCRAWDLATLLDHMVDSLDALTEAADLGRVALTVPAGPPAAVPAVDRLRGRACALLAAWSALADDGAVHVGSGSLPSSVLACTGALEVAVHGWDVAQVTGSRAPLPAALARSLFAWAEVLVGPADRPGRFDPVVTGGSPDPAGRLLRFLGRPG